jgi:hypothetical protein
MVPSVTLIAMSTDNWEPPSNFLKKLFNVISMAHAKPEIPVRTRLKASAKPDKKPSHSSFQRDFHQKTATPLNN